MTEENIPWWNKEKGKTIGIGRGNYIHTKEHKIKSGKTLHQMYVDGIIKPNKSSWKKGNIPWNKGMKNFLSKETLQKRTETRMKTDGYRNSEIQKIKIGNKSRGRKHTKETIQKISNSKMGHSVSFEQIKKYKESRLNWVTPKKDTSIEIKIQEYLKQLGYEFYTHQYIKDIEHGYQCDILIPSINLVIECDGNYWHHYPIGREIDHIRTKELIEKGFKVLRLWEHEIKEMDIDTLKNKIMNSSRRN